MLTRRLRDVFGTPKLVVCMGSKVKSPSQVWRRTAIHGNQLGSNPQNSRRSPWGLDSQNSNGNPLGLDPQNSSLLVLGGECRSRTRLESCSGVSRFSSSAGLQVAEAAAASNSVKRLPVQVGASLKIDVSRTAATVNVSVGDNLEEVLIQPKWVQNDECSHWKLLDIESSDSRVDVRQNDVQSRDKQLAAVLEEINAQMPGRWCSLDVQAGLGSVYIQNVREGNLIVGTAGGNIKLGDMKGSDAHINSGGGDVEAHVMQARTSIQTGGGRLWVKRLQGTNIALDSDGGNVHLGSVYGDEVIVESRGGSVEAKEIQAQDKALVSSSGGSVVVNGIDGKVEVASQGGHVELQLNEHAEEVTVDAGKDGRVVLCLSARLTAQVKYEGTEGVVQEGSVLTAGPDFGIFEFSGTESASNRQVTTSDWRGSESYLPGGVTACKIHVSSAGQVHVKQRSWFELVTGNFP